MKTNSINGPKHYENYFLMRPESRANSGFLFWPGIAVVLKENGAMWVPVFVRQEAQFWRENYLKESFALATPLQFKPYKFAYIATGGPIGGSVDYKEFEA